METFVYIICDIYNAEISLSKDTLKGAKPGEVKALMSWTTPHKDTYYMRFSLARSNNLFILRSARFSVAFDVEELWDLRNYLEQLIRMEVGK
jgi:hypothetical protein